MKTTVDEKKGSAQPQGKAKLAENTKTQSKTRSKTQSKTKAGRQDNPTQQDKNEVEGDVITQNDGGFQADLKEVAIAIMKTIQLVGRSCSLNELARILRADQLKFFRDPTHATLETTGTFSHKSRLELRLTMSYLLDEEYLEMQDIRYQGLVVSSKGKAFMEEPNPILVDFEQIRCNPFELYFHRTLRELRLRLSRERGVPIYAIYTDHCIDQIVKDQPETLKELTLIRGLDDNQVAVFGALILKNLDEMRENWHHIKNLRLAGKVKNGTHQEVKRLHEEGFTVEEIAGMNGIKQATVERYLCDFHMAGIMDLRPWIESYLEEEELQPAAKYFKERPGALLREAKEVLGIEYNKLFLGRIYTQEFKALPVRATA